MNQSHFDRFWIIVDSGVKTSTVLYVAGGRESRASGANIKTDILPWKSGSQATIPCHGFRIQQTWPAGAQFHFESAQVSQEVFVRNLEL